MNHILIRNAILINEGKSFHSDLYIKGDRIEKIDSHISLGSLAYQEVSAEGHYLIPGMIDDQVHFREPGLTHKGNIFTESRAAIAGGITSFMEMPNTVPNALTQELLQEKFNIASKNSLANYSFYMGVGLQNFEEVIKTDLRTRCGIKIFLGSSTGNMLVDDPFILEKIFSSCPNLIAVHCEDEHTIHQNLILAKEKWGDHIPPFYHPIIRNEEACYKSSHFAVGLAQKFGSRLHVLHISTAKELGLFDSSIPISEKRITAEACIHHLWFSDHDYEKLGNHIKWNPAIKTKQDQEAIRLAVKNGTIDVIATDHAPHTLEEKSLPYLQCPSGGPLVQHALLALFELYHQGVFNLEEIVQKTSHYVADTFKIEERGYLREGYYADLCLFDLKEKTEVNQDSLLYKCGWSPFIGQEFNSRILSTWVNGNRIWDQGKIIDQSIGSELRFKA